MAAEYKTILDEWKKSIEDFYNKVTAAAAMDLAQIRTCKQEMEKMKEDFQTQMHQGQYIRDNECIILSAPKIIIGNVGKDGIMLDGNGEIIIRGQKLEMAGVGEAGTLNMSAPVIEQRAIDRGPDGIEEVVHDTSRIVSQAKSVVLDSQNPHIDPAYKGTFLDAPGADGITITSEKGIQVSATTGNTTKNTAVGNKKSGHDTSIGTKKTEVKDKKDVLLDDIDTLITVLTPADGSNKDDDLTRSNALVLDLVAKELKDLLPGFYRDLNEYMSQVAQLAELERKSKTMELESTNLPSADDYAKSTGANITLQSEQINLYSKDGDGAWRTNEGAGVDIRANDIQLHSVFKDKDNHDQSPENGSVTINSHSVAISTAEVKNATYDDNNKLTSAEYPLVGEISILSKKINLLSLDLKQTDADGKMEETALTEKGSINLRAENVDVSATGTDGKATGSIAMNAKNVTLKAMDADNENKDSQLAGDGNMVLLAEKMHIGYKPGANIRSQNVKMASENEIVVGGKTQTVIASDGSRLDLTGKNVKVLANDKLLLSSKGCSTVQGEIEFKGKIAAGDIEANNITAKGQIAGQNIKDGPKIPSPKQVVENANTPDIIKN